MQICHRCGSDLGKLDRVGRRETCFKCGSDLHCCLNCKFYDASLHNQCRETEAERQVDKSVGNFCDFFSFTPGPRVSGTTPADAARAKLDALFSKKKPDPGA